VELRRALGRHMVGHAAIPALWRAPVGARNTSIENMMRDSDEFGTT
jgi:hypothetical protein